MTHWYLPGLLGLVLFTGAQAAHLKASLDDIVLLSQRGVSDKTLLLFLENRKAAFTLDAESIDKLILAGVSEDVIRYLLAREPIVHTSRPAVIYPVSTYVETYPRYYYTPRYYRTPYYSGYRAHSGHRATHFGGRHDKDNRRDKHGKDDQSHAGRVGRNHRGEELAHTGTSGSHRSRGDRSRGDHSRRGESHSSKGHRSGSGHSRGGGH